MYNKLEALREKGDAEKMIASRDYAGARDKLLKAQQLFPALDHIVAMLTVCDILSASRSIIPGYDTDYYWVLQLVPSSSSSDVKWQYEKLVNLLQPIKGKLSGTDLALKLIQESFSVLSDMSKRLTFDSKRGTSWANYESFTVYAPFFSSMSAKETGVSAPVPSAHDDKAFSCYVWDGSNENDLPMHMEKVNEVEPEILSNHSSYKQNAHIVLKKSSSFSSEINSEGNTGEDIGMPADDINSSEKKTNPGSKGDLSWSVKPAVDKKVNQDFFNFVDNRTVECFRIGQIWATHYHLDEAQEHRYAQINTISKSSIGVRWLKPIPVSRGERRWCDAGLPVACGSFCLDLHTCAQVSRPMVYSYNCSWATGVTEEQYEIYPMKGEVWALYKDWDLDEWSYNPEMIKGCRFNLVEILSDFSKYRGAKVVCLVKVYGFHSIFQRETKEGNPYVIHLSPSNLYMLSHNVPAYKFAGGEIDGIDSGMFELDQYALSDTKIQDIETQMLPKEETLKLFDSADSAEQLTSLEPNLESTLGPKLTLNDIATGQVWAVYFGPDLMPRRYARITNVITGGEVWFTLLEFQPIFDYEVQWKKENLPVVCGIFRAKETPIDLNISQLSHLVNCQMSITRPIYKIYPRKGEVWSVYRNWNRDWKRSDYENYQCWIVEILLDFSDEETMMIAMLEEVNGCLTFFHRQKRDGFDMTRAVSKNEMLGFSHQIPAYRVPGIGHYGIPENSWHLEPNALPLHHGNKV